MFITLVYLDNIFLKFMLFNKIYLNRHLYQIIDDYYTNNE